MVDVAQFGRDLTSDPRRMDGERASRVEEIRAEVLPDQKAEAVKRLQGEGRTVAMVGDGINDAPALTQADIGLAVGRGTDIAMESADITLVRDDLRLVAEAIRLSRANPCVVTRIPPSRSSSWASNPAEISTNSGAKARAAGLSFSSKTFR